MTKDKEKKQTALLYATVFLSGAMIMIFELTGSRILAPYFGSGMDSWTTLIGTILAFLSLGYYLGGKLADREPKITTIGLLLAAAALTITVVDYLRDPILISLFRLQAPLIVSVITAGILLFALPSTLLGMIQPYILKLSIKNIKSVGEIGGLISTLSTAGGIFGTFLGGFYVIPLLGTNLTLFLLVLNLLALSLAYRGRIKVKLLIGLTSVLIFGVKLTSPPLLNAVADVDTRYSRVLVKNILYEGEPAHALTFEPFGLQSTVYLEKPDELAGQYLEFFEYATNFHPNPNHVVMVGGGAFVYPEHYARENPEDLVSVFEVDEKLLPIAEEYLNYEPQANVKIYFQDGRYGLQELNRTVDIVILDAFSGLSSIPIHLTTQEYLGQLKQAGNSQTVVVANLIGQIVPGQTGFLESYLATFREEFASVKVFQVRPETNLQERQNFIIIAQDEELELYGDKNLEFSKQEIAIDTAGVRLLTDDWAPVHYFNRRFFN